MAMKVTYVIGSDTKDCWAALYVDGEKEWEYHSLDVDDLSAIVKNKPFVLEVLHEPYVVGEKYPDKLEDLVPSKRRKGGR